MLAGYRPEDAGLDIGDSAITETYGIGGFAMAAAPAIVPLVGGSAEQAIAWSRKMAEITAGSNPNITVPQLGFRGIPSGIDIRRVFSICYTWFGIKMVRQTGRKDVTALPSGPSAPSIFTVTFLVLMPVYQQTGDADFAIQIGLVWCFVEALILTGGAFLGDAIRRMIPRTVLLSCLSGLGCYCWP